MKTLIVLLLVAVSSTALMYFRANLRVSAITSAIFLVISVFSGAAIWLSILLLVSTLVLGLLSMDELRKEYVSVPLFRWYKKSLPPISDTEKEAIDAGTVWWDGELFSGDPDWNKLLAHDKAEVSAEEQAFLDGPVEEVCQMVNTWEVNHNQADVPDDVLEVLKKEKFLGLIIPEEYGGRELSAVAQTEVLSKLLAVGSVVANFVVVPNSLGPGELLMKYGTDEQKDHYLPRLATGEEIPCFALTAPTAGSDATSIPDRGVVCKGEWEGKEIIGMRITFDKRYITLAPVATLIGLAFQLEDPDHLIGDVDDYGITCALIPRDTQGLEIGNRHMPVGDPFLNGPVRGQDMFVPLDYIIGGQEMAGKGWRMLVNCLSAGRCVSLPSISNGMAKACVATTGAYARIRKQFNVSLSQMEGIQKPLAHMAGLSYIISAGRKQTAVALDSGHKPAVPSAILKYHCTEMAREVVNHAFDIHAGKAVMKGPKNYLSSAYEGIPVAITVEGANIMTRSLMIFGQGVVRCHPYILKEMQLATANDELAAEQEFDEVLFNHIGFAYTNGARSMVHALSGSLFAGAPENTPLKRYYQHATRFSAALALAADMSMMVMQGSLKRKEMISGRLGDLLSYLYLLSMVLKQYEDDGNPHQDLPLVEWACQYLLYQFQQAMYGIINNFPNRFMAMKLRFVTFPLGATFSMPSDKLHARVSDLMSADTETRSRLISGIFVGAEDTHPVAKLNLLLQQADEMDVIDKKIRTAIKSGQLPEISGLERINAAEEAGVISNEEADKFRDFDARAMDIIHVDDFPYDSFRRDKTVTKKKSGSRKRKSTEEEETID